MYRGNKWAKIKNVWWNSCIYMIMDGGYSSHLQCWCDWLSVDWAFYNKFTVSYIICICKETGGGQTDDTPGKNAPPPSGKFCSFFSSLNGLNKASIPLDFALKKTDFAIKTNPKFSYPSLFSQNLNIWHSINPPGQILAWSLWRKQVVDVNMQQKKKKNPKSQNVAQPGKHAGVASLTANFSSST